MNYVFNDELRKGMDCSGKGALIDVLNCEYGPDSYLRTCDQYTPYPDCPDRYDQIYFSKGLNLLILRIGVQIWVKSEDPAKKIGDISVNGEVSFAEVMNKLYLADGINLYVSDGLSVKIVKTGAQLVKCALTGEKFKVPECMPEMVVAWENRLVFAANDLLAFSGLMDGENWVHKDDDPSSAQYVYIGVDKQSITALCGLYSDLIVFKAECIYKFAGYFPDVSLIMLSQCAGAFNFNCAVQVDNRVFFVGKAGFSALNTVVDYGDVKQSYEGARIWALLQPNISKKIGLFYSQSKNTVYIYGQSDIFAYNLAVGGAWTRINYSNSFSSFCVVHDLFLGLDFPGRIQQFNATDMSDCNAVSKLVFTRLDFLNKGFLKKVVLSLARDADCIGVVGFNNDSMEIVFTPDWESPLCDQDTEDDSLLKEKYDSTAWQLYTNPELAIRRMALLCEFLFLSVTFTKGWMNVKELLVAVEDMN